MKFAGLWIGAPILAIWLIYQGIRYGVYCHHDSANRETSRQIIDAISHSDYRGAWQLHGTLVTRDWLGIGRYDHLCAGFDSRLADAEKLSKACAYIVARKSSLQAGAQCLAAINSSGRDVSEAWGVCTRALENIGEFERKVTGEDVVNPSIDLVARRKRAEERQVIADKAVGALYKAAFWSSPFFVLPSEGGKYRLGILGPVQSCTIVELCQFAKKLFDSHFFTMLQDPRPLSGYDMALMERVSRHGGTAQLQKPWRRLGRFLGRDSPGDDFWRRFHGMLLHQGRLRFYGRRKLLSGRNDNRISLERCP